MFVTNHVLAGSLLGMALRRRPTLAFAAGAASHLAMDALRHWGADGDDDRWLRAARRDGVACVAVLAAVTCAAPRSARAGIAAGGLGGVAPDLRALTERYLGVQPFPEAFDRFHDRVQEGKEAPEHLPRELAAAGALAVAAAAGLRRVRRHAASRRPSRPIASDQRLGRAPRRHEPGGHR
jgi:hypothetical protein